MSDGIVIRSAAAADANAIDTVHRAAFSGTKLGYRGEAELVRMIEDDGDTLVSFVARQRNGIIGHVLFSRMDVEADGKAMPAAGLAPVAALPDKRGQGIGDALIRAGLDTLREQGVAISFVVGHEEYYPRFGYSSELASRFASPFAGPLFMAMMLDSNAPWPLGGRADYAPAFGRMG